jgi:hypothetical protein
VTIVLERPVRIRSIRARRSGLLEERDVHLVDRIPAATAARLMNDMSGPGYRVLHFTSDFTDHQIARAVARALGLSVPKPAPEGPQSFKQWCGRGR